MYRSRADSCATSTPPLRSCSIPQKQAWLANIQEPGTSTSHVVARLETFGRCEDQEINRAWQQLVARHYALRSFFGVVDGELAQGVKPHVPFEVLYHDLRATASASPQEELHRICIRQARLPFDIRKAPLFRVSCCNLSEDRQVIFITAHRLICDEASLEILVQEFRELRMNGFDMTRLTPLPGGIAIFDEHHEGRKWSPCPNTTHALTSPREVFRADTAVQILTDYPRTDSRAASGAISFLLVDESVTKHLEELVDKHSWSREALWFATIVVFLRRYCGQSQISVDVNRSIGQRGHFDGALGNLVVRDTVTLDLSDDPTFVDVVKRVTWCQECRPTGSLDADSGHDRSPIVISLDQKVHDYNGTETFLKTADDLHFDLSTLGKSWRVACEYRGDLFAEASIVQFIERLNVLLGRIVTHSSERISRFPFLSDRERDDLVITANATREVYPQESTVVDMFVAQAQRTPDATAVICGKSRLSYAELEADSNRLARSLTSRGIGRGMRVGILLERSSDLVVALLAALKAGSAYVPLDATYPVQRLAYIIGNSKPAALITTQALRHRAGVDDSTFIFLDSDATEIATQSCDPFNSGLLPTDLAYIIYTSGSTGNPKGVEIEHSSLTNLLCSVRRSPGICASDVLVAVTTISFDIAAVDMFLPLIVGARLVIAKKSETVDGSELWQLLRRERATIMQSTPASWHLLTEAGWCGDPALKMLSSGEALSRKLADKLLHCGKELWNMYGPTETTIWSSAMRVSGGLGPVLLGPPIANTQMYVLDENLQLVPPGFPGELYIGGDGVARGYFDRPDLTAERFLPDRFRNRPAAKLYRTGDIVRRREPGTMEFLGRSDQQIKLRGFRIEIGEIETALLQQDDVREVAVVLRGDEAEDRALWAFVVRSENRRDDEERWLATLRARLVESLPKYMIPSVIAVLGELPRLPNGKLDRSALPETVAGPTTPLISSPSTSIELVLAEMISALLGRSTIGLDDDIFDLGFHSLLAVRLVRSLNQQLGIHLPFSTLTRERTIHRLVTWLVGPRRFNDAEGLRSPIVKLNPLGVRFPFIYFHSDIIADGMYVRAIAAQMPDQPIYSVSPHGTCGLPMMSSIEAMAHSFVEIIRDVQPYGPYRLGGFCAGGVVAYEVAQLLQSQGEQIDALVLVNSPAPFRHTFGVADRLVGSLARNSSLGASFRESMCHKVARVAEAINAGPIEAWALLKRRINSEWAIPNHRLGRGELQTFEKRRGSPETELYLEHLAAELVYRAKPYDGRITLVWGDGQRNLSTDPTFGWRSLTKEVQVVPMSGGHVAPLHDRTEELGRILNQVLHTVT